MARCPDVLAGRDLTGSGTWLSVSRDGRFAALTNYRAPSETRPNTPTRGTLVSAFLVGKQEAPMDYLERVAREGHRYNGFNLLCGDFARRELGWYGNRTDAPPALLDAGVHGLSNSLLNMPWPKLVAQREALCDLIHADERPSLDVLIETLRDPRIANDESLPSTGISIERERVLSAAFIETPEYGTRRTTALRVNRSARGLSLEIKERSDDDGSHRIVRPGEIRAGVCVRDRRLNASVERRAQRAHRIRMRVGHFRHEPAHLEELVDHKTRGSRLRSA